MWKLWGNVHNKYIKQVTPALLYYNEKQPVIVNNKTSLYPGCFSEKNLNPFYRASEMLMEVVWATRLLLLSCSASHTHALVTTSPNTEGADLVMICFSRFQSCFLTPPDNFPQSSVTCRGEVSHCESHRQLWFLSGARLLQHTSEVSTCPLLHFRDVGVRACQWDQNVCQEQKEETKVDWVFSL